MPSWSFSTVEAGEPEERAEEENLVESKSGERNAEKMGSEEKESRGDEDGDDDSGEREVGVVGVVLVVLRSLKVERRWSGEEAVVVVVGIADLWILVVKPLLCVFNKQLCVLGLLRCLCA